MAMTRTSASRRDLILLVLGCCIGPFVFGCVFGGNSGTNCRSYTVALDGGASGFSSVGEWRTDAICGQYCQPDYPICQLATANSVKCQMACE